MSLKVLDFMLGEVKIMNKEKKLDSCKENIFETENEEVDAYIVESNHSGKRLDLYLSEKYNDVSRSYIQKLIKDDRVLVNSKKEKPSYKLSIGDELLLMIPEEKELQLLPQKINLNIIYEDEGLLIVNKEQGMVVHPAPGNPDKTLVNALLYHCGESLSTLNGKIRPGIVHRIDKNTSGLLVVAKNNFVHEHLAKQFAIHSITREYEMLTVGNVDWDKMTVNKPLGRNPKNRLKRAVVIDGKRAVTHFKVIEDLNGFTYMKASLETGRTHQIRVHSSYIKHPIVGDDLYGYKIKKFSNLQGQMLHARKLGFIHPLTEKYVEFTSELPEDFLKTLNKMRSL